MHFNIVLNGWKVPDHIMETWFFILSSHFKTGRIKDFLEGGQIMIFVSIFF